MATNNLVIGRLFGKFMLKDGRSVLGDGFCGAKWGNRYFKIILKIITVSSNRVTGIHDIRITK